MYLFLPLGTQLGLADEDYWACRSAGLSVTADADADTFKKLFHRSIFRVTVREVSYVIAPF